MFGIHIYGLIWGVIESKKSAFPWYHYSYCYYWLLHTFNKSFMFSNSVLNISAISDRIEVLPGIFACGLQYWNRSAQASLSTKENGSSSFTMTWARRRLKPSIVNFWNSCQLKWNLAFIFYLIYHQISVHFT